ncbi:MAG: tetratricopeptide repeat protein, partial [Aggregatilineales bacterium]
MAEISLKEYHQKLEALLKANQVDETIHHCRHILQYFPRNAATYRYLGRALLASGSLAEAAEVFRRVLSVYPDDITAHTSLAAVYRQQGQYDAAIWHLERAYEQDTANLEYQQALRELYSQRRGVEQTRLQLTAAAAARHYASSGLYDQAARTLQEALNAAPQRADLRLLLARTLSESGQAVESAEAALDTLEALPDCLEANCIMARFWLSEQRPSDAQRYLSRIEALDPYEAYLIAQGSPPPETAFALLELDYSRVVKRRLATETPDWLEAIDPAPAQAAEAAPAPAADSDLPEWLFGGDSLSLDETFSAPELTAAEGGAALPAFDDEPPAVEEAQPAARTGLTGMLAALDRGVTAADVEQTSAATDEPALAGSELADWLLEAAPPEVAGAAADDASAAWFDELPAVSDEFDPLA